MIYPIVRMYGSAQQATDAVRKLHEEGFPADVVDLITSASGQAAGGAAPGSGDPLVDAITAGYVLKSHAMVYAQGIRRGGSLVIVRAPFSYGTDAIAILDSFGPVDSGVEMRVDNWAGWDEATPLSSILWLPLLAKGSSGISSFWNLPLLTRTGRTLCTVLGIGELASPASPLSGALGLPTISRRSAPLSSALGLPLLRA